MASTVAVQPASGPATDWRAWGADLCHPLPMAAVCLLLVNDHLLKGSGLLPGWLTGKLSDLAGLFFFPLLLVALAQGLWSLLRRAAFPWRRPLVLGAVVATGVVFAAAKTWSAFHAVFTPLWGPMVMDPTDLLALPVLVLAARWMEVRGAG